MTPPAPASGSQAPPASRPRRRLREALFAAIPTLVLLGGLALGFVGEPENDPALNASPLWGPGDPFYAADPRRRKNLADPVLIWRGRPNDAGTWRYVEADATNLYETNAYGFRDDPVAVPKPPGTTRVLAVGDSATWGLNLPARADSYPDQLERLLGARFDVVNAGVVGYSSFQGARLVEQWAAELEPDVVTVYLGNNDPSPSGTKDAARAAAGAGALHRWLRYNRFYLLALRGLLALRATRADADRARLVATLADPEAEAQRDVASYYRLLARVPPDAYEENLRRIVRASRAAGARPILLAVPTNLGWPPKVRPFASEVLPADGFWSAVKVEGGYLGRVHRARPACVASPAWAGHPYLCLVTPADLARAALPGVAALEARARDATAPARERVRHAHNGAVRRLAEGDAAAAEAGLAAALAQADACTCVAPAQRAWMLYNLGAARLAAGRRGPALEALHGARAAWPFASGPDYEARLRRVAEEERVERIDLPALFAAADPAFAGSALLHDWVHPNREGNAVIARALAARLRPDP